MKILPKTLPLLFFLCAFPAFGEIKIKETLEISIQGVPASEKSRIEMRTEVSKAGTITMWGIGKVQAAGKTPSELAQNIAAAYKKKGIYADPTFQVIPQDAGKTIQDTITVGGHVVGSGTKPYLEGMTLFDAVSVAGGATNFGAENRVKLIRNNKSYIYNLEIDAHKHLRIYPGDRIDVPQKNWRGR